MMGKMMGMGMDRMGAMSQSGMQSSALPGFPGATHIYHVGSTNFFLDHSGHISLSTEQQAQLNSQKQAALLEQATFEREIEQAEQDLWTLTGSDAPDAMKIEAQVRSVERMRADQRIAFIRAVGNAAVVLTVEQLNQLTGFAPANPAPQSAMPPNSGGSMAGAAGAMTDM